MTYLATGTCYLQVYVLTGRDWCFRQYAIAEGLGLIKESGGYRFWEVCHMRYRIYKIGIHILAFMVARCTLLGMYPFVVPFFMAAYLQDMSSVSVFVALLFGVLSRFEGQEVLRYGIVLVFLLVMLNRTKREVIFSGNLQIALAAGAILWAVSMPFEYIVTGRITSLLYTLLEGVIAGCMTLVFEQGFAAMRVGTGRMFADNRRFIGLFSLIGTGMFGCPQIHYPFSLPFVLSGYILLYNAYRFDAGIGIAMGSLCGVVMAFSTGEIAYLAVMIAVSGLVVVLKEIGKPGALLAYVAGMILLGATYENSLLETNMLVSTIIVAAVFLLTPESALKRIVTRDVEITRTSQDILVQEATKRQIENFGQAFIAMEKMLSLHEREWEDHIPNGISNMYLSGDGISLLNAVESENSRLNDMRRNFIRQLRQVGEIITGFQGEIMEETFPVDNFEARITDRLRNRGVETSKAVCLRDKDGRIQVLIRCRISGNRIVSGKMLARSVGNVVRRGMYCVGRNEDLVGREESIFSFIEEGKYLLTTGLMRKNRMGEVMCGDNFSVTKLDNEKVVCMISDGMGSGENAYIKSRQIVDLLEQLLSAGFGRELAVELMNSFISFLTGGGGSSTLDLTVFDLYTGMADFIKLGASTTFIRRGDRVECIRSSSLPVGVLEEIEFDTCERKLYDGDIIVMISDGILDGVVNDNKEDYLAGLIAGMETENVQKFAQLIMEDVERMQQGGLRDDSTVMVVGVWER